MGKDSFAPPFQGDLEDLSDGVSAVIPSNDNFVFVDYDVLFAPPVFQPGWQDDTLVLDDLDDLDRAVFSLLDPPNSPPNTGQDFNYEVNDTGQSADESYSPRAEHAVAESQDAPQFYTFSPDLVSNDFDATNPPAAEGLTTGQTVSAAGMGEDVYNPTTDPVNAAPHRGLAFRTRFPGATLEELTERRREQNRIAQARKRAARRAERQEKACATI